MKLLIDMNLSPVWQPLLHEHGYEAVHWSAIGAHNAPDTEIMQWARGHERVVLTHDLDFGTLLAHSRNRKPSVIQARTQDASPEHLGPAVLHVLRTQREALERGALITIDEQKSRVRILPL